MKTRYKILALEDSEDDAILNRHFLEKTGMPFDYKWITTLEEFKDALVNYQPDVILADYNLITFTGLDALKVYREHEERVPFIIVSGTLAEERVIDLIKAGAWDFINKDRPERLEYAITKNVNEYNQKVALKESKKLLLEQQNRMDLAAKGANLGIWEWDLNTGKIVFNQRYAQMLHYDYASLANKMTLNIDFPEQWEKYIYKDDIPDCLEALKKHLLGESYSYQSEHRIKCADKSLKWVLDTGRIFSYDKDGAPEKIVGVRLDIDEKKKMEFKLHESLKRYFRLIENLPGVTYRCHNDPERSVDYISLGLTELSGYSLTEFKDIHNNKLNKLIHPADIDNVNNKIAESIHENTKYHINYRIKHKDGRELWIWEQGGMVYDEPTKKHYLEGFFHDITHRKKTEEKMLSTVMETEDKERKRFAKEMHDGLGQQLSASFLNLQVVKKYRDALPEVAQQKLDNSLQFLQTAIEESRNIAHNLMPKSIEDAGYVKTMESMLAALEGTVDTSFFFYTNLKKRLGKNLEVSLYRITQEAINNIIKYAKASKASIQLMEYEDIIHFSIEDNGKGFNEDSLEHSFGIINMKNRAISLGGDFEIESNTRNGTIITIEIPK